METHISELVSALQGVMNAVAEESEARKKSDDVSWDYFGANYINAVADAEREFEKSLEIYINERVDAAISKKAEYGG